MGVRFCPPHLVNNDCTCCCVQVTVTGRQAHGAMPHLGVDPIVATAHIITAVQTIAGRNVDPTDAVVVTCGEARPLPSFSKLCR